MWLRLASFLIIAAAAVWLAACSGAAVGNPDIAPSVTGARSNPPTSAGPTNPSPPAGEESPTGSSPAAAPTGVRPKTLTAKDPGQGGVTIKATWVVPGSPEAASVKLDRELGFAVEMDTHSGDLGRYDLAKLSAVRDDKGQELQPLAWEGTSEGSHHRAGILTLARGIEQSSKYLDLVIRDVGGAKERVLRWELQ